MDKAHDIKSLKFTADQMEIQVDGTSHVFPLAEISKSLLKASTEERKRFEISPSGYGIHWPLIGEDISIDALLGIDHEAPDLTHAI